MADQIQHINLEMDAHDLAECGLSSAYKITI